MYKICSYNIPWSLIASYYIIFYLDKIQELTATTARELQAFVNEGLQIRQFGKRKYRINEKRIKKASAEFANHKDVGRFLNAVTYSVEGLFQNSFAEDEEEDPTNEEFLLAPLSGNLPPEFDIGMLLIIYYL